MKKLASLLLAALFLLTLPTGCSSSATNTPVGDDEIITLRFWTHLEEPWNLSEDKMIASFHEKYPNIRIERESFPYDEYESKIQTSLISKSGGADIYQIWGGWGIDFAPTGIFSPVPDSLRDELKNDCYEPVLGALAYDGQLYGAPLEFNAEWGGMLVNKRYFDENDLSYPTTWDGMIALATEHSISSGDIFEMRGFDFVSWDSAPYMLLSMILSSGGQYVTGGDQFDFNTPIAIESLGKLADYITVNKITSIVGLTGGEELDNVDWLFLGKALMTPRGIWSIPVGVNDYGVEFGIDFDYVSIPFYGAERKWAAETGWALAVNANSANVGAAWQFVEFMMEKENLLQLNIDCGMIPPRKSVAHDPVLLETMPYAKPIIDVLDGALFIGRINTDVLKEAITDALVDMVQNGTAATEAVLAINRALE